MGAQLQARHIFHPNRPAIWRLAHNDVAELLRGRQTALGQHCIGVLLIRGSRLASNLPSRIDSVLGFYRVYNIGDRDAELRQLVRIHPEPHRILACAENDRLADAVQARDGIIQVDVGVVGKIGSIVRTMWRINGDQHERSGGRLLEGDTVAVHFGRQLTSGQLLT